MPSKVQQKPLESASWCRELCHGAEAHHILWSFLEKFQGNPQSYKLSPEAIQIMDEKLDDLSTHLGRADCDRLYGFAMETLRKSAFIDMTDGKSFVSRSYSILKKVWDDGYKRAKGKATDKRKLAKLVFSPQDFLDGWMRDLPKVKPEFLSPYLQILACEGLSNSQRFNKAIEKFQRHILETVIAADVTLADSCGDALIRNVLEPMLDKNRLKLIECLPHVSKIAIECALVGGFESIERLDFIVYKLGKPKVKKDGSTYRQYELLSNIYSEVLKMLSETYRKARNRREPIYVDLCRYLESIIPKVACWSRERRLAAPAELCIKLKTLVGKTLREFEGTVRDLDKQGHCYHVCCNNLTDCFVIKGTENPIPGYKKLQSVALCVTDKLKQTWRIDEALAQIYLPPKIPGQPPREIQSRVLPVRGWQYKDEGKAGIVFWLEKPPPIHDISDMAEMLAHESEAEQTAVKSLPSKVKHELKSKQKSQPLSHAPFFYGEPELLREIQEWFEKLADDILRERRWRGLWARGKPVDELAIDGQIRQDLKQYVELRGGHLGSQEDTGLGPCDYLVSRGNEKVVAELKPSYGAWQQGIDAELATHMDRAGTRYGLFVVFAFNKKFKKGSNEIRDLVNRRDMVCRKNKVRIDIIVISCDKPESASRRKEPPRAREGLQKYEGTSADT